MSTATHSPLVHDGSVRDESDDMIVDPSSQPAWSSEQPSAPNVIEILKAFFAAQEQRRSHWAEFDDALASINSPADAASNSARSGQHHSSSAQADAHDSPATSARGCQACSAQSLSSLPLTETDLPRILSLVTAGLLDASHRVRTCSTELRGRQEEDLATSVDRVQDLENDVLRSVVRIETIRRDGQRDHHDEVQQCSDRIRSCREEIQEACAEIQAELAERTLETAE
ncbi:hypothetical protein IE81DRAFT_322637 [Ceraceosorus guamensis]|uniref:Uncharacterized protein n=1 Tax=Ceraceosorus guamensis TaxID=1522189 RepID=A0A316VZN0_9BASI|nr:hypothetical protein IE81DRAFT_322637 [Ceraceosorus guamensis]PWN43127.1 hypothetical protein IE81DRAFT_322637 [Ceraceosorus guamensis]